MKVEEKTRQEIEAKSSQMSDFLKMEYLESCIKQHREFDIKRFCNVKLAELYEKRNMFSEAARNSAAAADMAVTFKEKIDAYLKETELWIRAGIYERADESFRKALASGNSQEKYEAKRAVKEYYKKQAGIYEKAGKSTNALKAYLKLIEMTEDAEKTEVKKKILALYSRLGKIKEYGALKAQLDGNSS